MSDTHEPFPGGARVIRFADIECAPLGDFKMYVAFTNWLVEQTVEAIFENPELAEQRIWCVITPESFSHE